MITLNNIIEWSKPHKNKIENARHTIIETPTIVISIVGGGKGLYGDFKDTFELAVFDKESGNFMTKFFYDEGSDDVIGYMESEKMLDFVNQLTSKGFQVR